MKNFQQAQENLERKKKGPNESWRIGTGSFNYNTCYTFTSPAPALSQVFHWTITQKLERKLIRRGMYVSMFVLETFEL